VVAVVIGGVGQVAGARAARPQVPVTRYYLALGDSAPIWNGPRSYPDLITKQESPTVPGLKLVNLACSGETTASFIKGSLCARGGSQLNDAKSFLKRHLHHVVLVTIDIGGNDIVGCASASNPTQCVAAGLTTIKKNLTAIMTVLRRAAGPATPIVGMNYYDPVLGDWLAGASLRSLAVASAKVLATLNTLLASIYLRTGKGPTADVQNSFQSLNFSKIVPSRWGRVPISVSRACGWLDISCTRGQPEGFGDDPNASGAIVIAGAFMRVIPQLARS
jgi:lysophospholipase L1-like esterase